MQNGFDPCFHHAKRNRTHMTCKTGLCKTFQNKFKCFHCHYKNLCQPHTINPGNNYFAKFSQMFCKVRLQNFCGSQSWLQFFCIFFAKLLQFFRKFSGRHRSLLLQMLSHTLWPFWEPNSDTTQNRVCEFRTDFTWCSEEVLHCLCTGVTCMCALQKWLRVVSH